jgi:hypothetical protein
LPVPRDQVAGAWPAGNDVILLAGQQGFECSHLHGRVDPLRVQHQDARVRLTAEGRARRETVRLRAAEMFAQDADPVQIAQIDCLPKVHMRKPAARFKASLRASATATC